MKQSMHAKRMAKHHKRSKGQTKLNLVSLMDIFTILVFFLLVNSSDVEVLENDKAIKLPTSVAEKLPEEMLVVKVSNDEILINGRTIIAVNIVMENSGKEIEALKTELEYLSSRAPYKTAEDKAKGREVTIMGDSEIPYLLLKKIMTTCALTEYRNISLAVSQIPKEVSEEAVGG